MTEPRESQAELEQRAEWLERLRGLVHALTSTTELQPLLERILDEAIAATGAVKGCLAAPDASGELLLLAARRAGGQPHHASDEFSRSLIGAAYREDRTMLVNNALSDPRTMDLGSVDVLGLGAVLCYPLRHRGQVLGVIYLEGDSRTPFGMEQLIRLQEFASCAALALAAGGERGAPAARPAGGARLPFSGILGNNPQILHALSIVRRVASADVPVLLVGETGTGKELFARALHRAGPRGDRAFVALNCGAIPANLVESELFGHERGAFTGAVGTHHGVFEQAAGGTLLLDEVEVLPLPAQATLLRVLETGDLRRVGGEQTLRADARVIAAANLDLERMVAEGSFRRDLYYRLKGIRIDVPPLRERREDIPILVDHFLAQFRERHGKHVVALRPWAWQALMRADYPGNVRELKHIVEHGVLLCQHEQIWLEDLPPDLQQRAAAAAHQGAHALPVPATHEELKAAKQELRNQLERMFVLRALQRAGGNISEAARQTGMNRVQLQRLVGSLMIDTEQVRRTAVQ